MVAASSNAARGFFRQKESGVAEPGHFSRCCVSTACLTARASSTALPFPQ